MTWHAEYKRKLKTAEEALQAVVSGSRIWMQANSGTPLALMKALAEQSPRLRNVKISHLLTWGSLPTAEARYAGSFRHNAYFIGPNVREAVNEGNADYIPIHLAEVERFMEAGELSFDVALIQVSPPDGHGYVTMGPSVETTLTAARCARHVIAQVNDQVPRIRGITQLHVNQINAFVECSEPLAEVPPHPSSEVHRKIAQHVAGLIEDGSTIQMGVGGLPDAVLSSLEGRSDLGMHSEVFSDGVIPLIESGVINCRRKSFYPYKAVAGIAFGTRRLYEYIDDNPFFEFLPSKFVNDPFLIAKNHRMVAINSALQIDLTGQVCAESIGQRFYSGFGGQLDFMRGAARAKWGKPVIALPSTAKQDSISRIVPLLDSGAGVLTTRADVHYVATEFGIVNLYGKSVRERAELLISIAHPNFREELFDHCVRQRWFQRNEVEAGDGS